jgi:hypothetical protein
MRTYLSVCHDLDYTSQGIQPVSDSRHLRLGPLLVLFCSNHPSLELLVHPAESLMVVRQDTVSRRDRLGSFEVFL